jgi:hypothetical protein
MAVLKPARVSGATLLEVVVALVIIMVVFGVSMMIYLNILRSTYTYRQLSSALLLKDIGEETISTKSYFDERIERDGIIVIKRIQKYNNQANLIHLHLETIDEGSKKLLTRDQLINTDEEE